MHLALTELQSGLALAAIYSLLSVSLTFTYRVCGVVQLAQADIMMCGAFAGYFVGKQTGSFALVLCTGVAVSALVSLVAYEGAFRWLLSGSHLPPLVVGLALSTVIEEALRIAFFQGQPEPFPSLHFTSSLSSTEINYLVIGIAIVVGVVLQVVVTRTKTGRQLRAVADHIEMARVLGIAAERVRMLAFVGGASLAGVAGILLAIVYGSISFNSGTSVEFTAIAAILLGGLGSVPGALVGSVVVALGQTFIGTYISSGWVNAYVFGIVLVTIIVRPSGIFGLLGKERA